MKLLVKRAFFALLAPYVSAVLAVGDDNAAYWSGYFRDRLPIFPCCYAVDNQFFQRKCSAASENREEFRRSLGLQA
jgi:hypothetical protein